MDVDLDLARIGEAAPVVDPVFRNSPSSPASSLCAVLGRSVLVTLETANPLGSFKGGGADFFVRSLPSGHRGVRIERELRPGPGLRRTGPGRGPKPGGSQAN